MQWRATQCLCPVLWTNGIKACSNLLSASKTGTALMAQSAWAIRFSNLTITSWTKNVCTLMFRVNSHPLGGHFDAWQCRLAQMRQSFATTMTSVYLAPGKFLNRWSGKINYLKSWQPLHLVVANIFGYCLLADLFWRWIVGQSFLIDAPKQTPLRLRSVT